MKIDKKRLVKYTIIFLIVIQIIRIDKTNSQVDISKDFIKITDAPEDIAAILKTSCYDCHSDEVVYPWYTDIAPVSWWIKHHINEGREHLNFSTWDNYTEKRRAHKLKECYQLVQENKMPMYSYTIMHGSAKLTPSQKTKLVEWFKSL
jgi:hypothetical protein